MITSPRAQAHKVLDLFCDTARAYNLGKNDIESLWILPSPTQPPNSDDCLMMVRLMVQPSLADVVASAEDGGTLTLLLYQSPAYYGLDRQRYLKEAAMLGEETGMVSLRYPEILHPKHGTLHLNAAFRTLIDFLETGRYPELELAYPAGSRLRQLFEGKVELAPLEAHDKVQPSATVHALPKEPFPQRANDRRTNTTSGSYTKYPKEKLPHHGMSGQFGFSVDPTEAAQKRQAALEEIGLMKPLGVNMYFVSSLAGLQFLLRTFYPSQTHLRDEDLPSQFPMIVSLVPSKEETIPRFNYLALDALLDGIGSQLLQHHLARKTS